ncbi:PREDICTED: TMV resistance protein N-like [Prunus mume]|uniref:TMV resistance protein N-like n=1 Tax=Prunus mume TaxID=102107 RepID=A0ABM0NYY5_PRUMU|nr:PREDICTED: TMV resistance protein N-like [Prunus mume]
MTTQPVSSSSSSSSSYDVFLSFRGDTRFNFTDHLYKALRDKGIYTFIDGELVRGEEISPALVKAIEESRISLIVFSENYASSRWCLDELVKILQCKQSKQQIVLPIFYKVDPSDVRKQTSKFGDAFEGLIKRKFKNDKEKVLIWREALTKVANLSGHTFKDGEYETTFINNIVDGILSQVLSCTYWNVAKYPVGIQSRVQDVERHLDVGGKDRRMVGIWGTSGIGKTTIAKAIWNAIAHKFEGSCFLSNVRENSMSDGDLIKLQEALLHKILGGEWKIHSVDEGIGVIKERLSHKKILLILDDVNQLKQLDNLAGVGWFGEGSRVITTTQDRGLLKCHGIDLIYEVQKLYGNQALELFSFCAFGTNKPPKDYLELAQRALEYAQGVPLALTILGSHLHNKDKDRWQDILDSYEGEPYTGIQKILQKSYDALENFMQQFFLDIACFFKGKKKDYVLQIVSNSKNKVSRDCIEVLIEKAMITIDCGTIQMHDLLEKLGKDIVHKESPNDPGKRSRLWFYEDVEQVLTENTGTRNIKGIIVKLPEPAEITLNPECFCNMVNLEIFINRNASLCGHINYLPNALRLIDWDRCQLQSLPPNFQGNRLVEFNMPRSRIRQLDRFNFKHLSKLTSMNLRGCQFLEKIPDLSGIPNIKYLNLRECTLLFEVDGSIGFLDKLVELDLGGCFNLTRFGTRLRLKSLKKLYLNILEKIVDLSGIPNLKYLNLSECKRLVEVDSSVGFLDKLVELDLRECFQLTRFGTRLRLKSLERLYLCDCKRLESFPEIEVEMESLRILYISGSGIRELPSSIAYLTGLSHLFAAYCENLAITFNSQVSSSNSELQLLPNLFQFNLTGCNLSKLDLLLHLDCWSTLTELDLSGNNFVNLPRCFSEFVNLRNLDLSYCQSLLEIPEQVLPPGVESVSLYNCTSLEKIPKLAWVLLDNCTSLEKIPELPRKDDNMYLSLINCVRLHGYDITENIFLNQVSVSSSHSHFDIRLPGDEVPKWFSCRKDATIVRPYLVTSPGTKKYNAGCEVSFEIPPNLKWETLRLVLCVVTQADAKILLNGKLVNERHIASWESHVQLTSIPLLDRHAYEFEEPLTKQGNTCQVIFDLFVKVPTPVKIPCGVHLLGHQVADVSETDVVDHGPTQLLLPDAMAVDDDTL